MGRKSVIHQYSMFGESGASMAASIDSNITNVEHLDKLSIHVSWTAGPAGEFKLYARNGGRNTGGSTFVPSNDSWYELNFGTPLTITGSDSEIQIVLNECPFTEIYLAYVRSSGTASDLYARLTAKTIGS